MAVPDRRGSWSVAEDWTEERQVGREPGRRVAPAQRRHPSQPRSGRDARAEARRRMRLIRRRRLDLLQDAGLGLVLAILVLVFTAGLGVVALLAIPAGLTLAGSLVVERRRRVARRAPRAPG